MKISQDVVNTFRLICNNETYTDDETVRFKITRNFILGDFIKEVDEESFIKAYGDLHILYFKGSIISIWHDKSRKVRVNQYTKYKWNYGHGRNDLNDTYN